MNITDDVNHECLGAIPDTSISGHRVARELTAIFARRGKPGIVSDNGTELTSHAISHGQKTMRSTGTTLARDGRWRVIHTCSDLPERDPLGM